MKRFSPRFLTHALAACAVAAFAFAVPARADVNVGFVDTQSWWSGSAHTYVPVTLTVQNFGTTDSTGVTFSFTLPKGLKIQLDSNYCSTVHGSQGARIVLCDFGPLAAGATASVTLSFLSAQAEMDSF